MVFIYLLFLYEVKEDGEVELIVFCLHLEVSLRVVAYGADLGSLLADDDVTTVGALYTISCSIKSRVHFRTDPMITKIIAAWKETNWGEPQLLNKLDVDEVELILPVPSPKSSNVGLSNELSIELPEGLSIRLSKELSKGLSETAATIFKLIYADNYITRGDMAEKIGISVTAVQKHINKLKSLRFIERDGSTGHGNWKIVEP